MKNNLSLSIAQPCSANWEKMSPAEQGRFCGLCNHTVVDFTQMNETEIKEYFTCHYGQKTCGRFKTSQLIQKKSSFKQFRETLFQKYNSRFTRPSVKSALLGCLTVLAFIAGCHRPVSRPTHRMGKVAYRQPNTTKTLNIPADTLK